MTASETDRLPAFACESLHHLTFCAEWAFLFRRNVLECRVEGGGGMYDTHIFLDFEMNPIPREFSEAREYCRAEICEIGAVKLDRNYEPVERYSRFVKPHYAPIAPHITGLTGIRDADVADAPSFAEAIADFADWIGGGTARIYSWSLSDWRQLDDEAWLKELELPWQLRQRWMDFQAVYTRLIGLSKPLALKYAVGAVDQRFDGSAHRAVDDAWNSAELLRIVKAGRLNEQAAVVRRALRPEESFGVSDEVRAKLAAWQAEHAQ